MMFLPSNISADFFLGNLDGVSDLFAEELGATADFNANTPISYSLDSLDRLLTFFQQQPIPRSPRIEIDPPEVSRRKRRKYGIGTPPINPNDKVEVIPSGENPYYDKDKELPDVEIDPKKNPQLGGIIQKGKEAAKSAELMDFLKGGSLLLVGVIVLVLLVLLFKK